MTKMLQYMVKKPQQRFISCGMVGMREREHIFIVVAVHVAVAVVACSAAATTNRLTKNNENNKNKMPCNIMDNQVDYKVGQSAVAFNFFHMKNSVSIKTNWKLSKKSRASGADIF